MKLIDTHCHVNFRDFREDADTAITRALSEDIGMIVVGSQRTTSQRAVEYADSNQNVWAVVGLHPVHLYAFDMEEEGQVIHTRSEEFDLEYYHDLAIQDKVVGIGEMGLDYYRLDEIKGVEPDEIKTKQRELLKQGISLAKEVNKPLIIHTRTKPEMNDVYEDVLDILDETDFYKCVLHCYSGNLDMAHQYIERGCMLSFTGIITFKNAKEMQGVAREISLERIMVETDAPYLAPEPHRGQRNEPAYVKHVAEKLAELKGMDFDEVAEMTTQNAISFFKLK